MNPAALSMMEIEAVDDSRLGKGWCGIRDEARFICDTASIVIDPVVARRCTRDMCTVPIGTDTAVIGHDFTCGEGAMSLVDSPIQDSDDLAFSMKAIVIQRGLIGDIRLNHPTGCRVSQGDVGSVLDKKHTF